MYWVELSTECLVHQTSHSPVMSITQRTQSQQDKREKPQFPHCCRIVWLLWDYFHVTVLYTVLTVSHQLPHLQSHLQPSPAQLLSCVINPPGNYIIFLFTVNTSQNTESFSTLFIQLFFYPIVCLLSLLTEHLEDVSIKLVILLVYH